MTLWKKKIGPQEVSEILLTRVPTEAAKSLELAVTETDLVPFIGRDEPSIVGPMVDVA
ncbi:MAG: hypothetical protein ACRDGM_01175 [bacterium]